MFPFSLSFFIYYLSLFSLKNTVNASFPNGSCKAQPCEGSPYRMEWLNVTDQGQFCFQVISSASSSTTECIEPCCSVFENLLKKFVIRSSPVCKTAFKMVTMNGIKKGGGVFFDLFGAGEAELRITSLNLNVTTAPSTVFCVSMSSPCQTLDAFCNGPCLYSVYDPYTHTCCPTCMFNTFYPLNPPPYIGVNMSPYPVEATFPSPVSPSPSPPNSPSPSPQNPPSPSRPNPPSPSPPNPPSPSPPNPPNKGPNKTIENLNRTNGKQQLVCNCTCDSAGI